ncbi:MAG: hypothetical protein JWL98_1921 [Xanthomonadaceae bacterium]|nr:hypothetical protein [Xanthomonadaceae bacterium]
MNSLTRWFAPALLAAGMGYGGAMVPATANAQDALSRVLVDVADVIFNGGTPYYRYGNYGPDDRLIVGRDAYGRRVYYRAIQPRRNDYRYAALRQRLRLLPEWTGQRRPLQQTWQMQRL